MSDISLQDVHKSQNESENDNNSNAITLDMEATENDEIQNKDNIRNPHECIKDDTRLKEKDVSISIETELLKPYIHNEAVRPMYRRQYWVQFVGRLEPIGSPLDYSPESRNSFVLLVFSIVFIMLMFTAAFILCVLMIPPFSDMFRRFGMFLVLPAAIILFALSYVIGCSQCARYPPCNYIILVVVVICMSIIAAYVSNRYKTTTVLYAVLATTLVVVVCMLLACTSFDFTKYLLYIVVISVAFGAIAIIVCLGMLITGTWIKPVHLGILIIGTLIQVIVLIVQLQLILGGGAVELGEDEYALGAYMLYTSLVSIFINMVQMIGMFE